MRRLSSNAAKAKAPATSPLLLTMRRTLDFTKPHDRVLWGAAVVGYFYLLRGGEYLQINGQVAPSILRYEDVRCLNAAGHPTDSEEATKQVSITLRGSKTDQEGRGVTLTLQESVNKRLCPVLALLSLLEHGRLAGLSKDKPLCSVDSSVVANGRAMTRHLRLAALRSGIEPLRLSTHSLRSGGATALMEAGVDAKVIKLLGRWSSDAVDRYTRLSATTTATLARKMATVHSTALDHGQ